MNLPEFEFTFEDFFVYVMSEKCYNENVTKYIDAYGRDHTVDAASLAEHQGTVQRALAEGCTIKLEDFEHTVGFTRGTVHVFYNMPMGYSFPDHTDLCHVIIECKDGVKCLAIEDEPMSLLPGNTVEIPIGTMHHARNDFEALIFSYGLHTQ